VDSTGIGSITHGKEVRLLKSPISPENLMQMKRCDALLVTGAKVLMGHNRAATRGKVNVVNAHPFWTGRYMVAHNGTLDYGCLRDMAKNTEGDTDSEQLANSIHELSSVKDAVALAAGAWALTVYDHEENTISIVRNKERPLFYAMAADCDTLYWASEPGMLRWILDRNGVDFNKKIYELPVDTLFTWEIPDSKHVFQEKPQRLEVKGKSVQNFPVHQPHRPPYNGRATWEDWVNQRDQRASQTANGGNNSSPASSAAATSLRDGDHQGYQPSDIHDMRSAEFEDVKWDVWALGFSDGENAAKGQTYNNPFHYQVDYPKWSQYQEGWEYGKMGKGSKTEDDNAPAEVTNKIDSELPFLLGDTDAELRAKVAANNVILVGDFKKKQVAESKRSSLFDTREGPDGKKITKAKFRQLTGHKCGWGECNITGDDKGEFRLLSSKDTKKVFVCAECLNDPNLQQQAKA